MYVPVPTEPEELWDEAQPRVHLMKDIIASHFGQNCDCGRELDQGSFARCFLYSLQDGKKLVARIILPARQHVKTESEVATMYFLRGAGDCFCLL